VFDRARRWFQVCLTVCVLAIAGVVAVVMWDYYTAAPWTRNGQVRAQVANLASRVTGPVIRVCVLDNQFVHRGDVLYVIDPYDFEIAVAAATARRDERKADLEFRLSAQARRERLPDISVSPEEKQQFRAQAHQAQAQYDAAVSALARAKIDLERTRIRSSVNGYVTNLTMREGDYATAGQSNVQVIDSDSYWVDGYFEETKVHGLHVGDPVRMDLMGYPKPLFGHVSSVTRGIATANAERSIQGLPSVDPVYTWVRLAQRIPVRVALDRMPEGVVLSAGMTATVTVVSASGNRAHESVREALFRAYAGVRHAAGRM